MVTRPPSPFPMVCGSSRQHRAIVLADDLPPHQDVGLCPGRFPLLGHQALEAQHVELDQVVVPISSGPRGYVHPVESPALGQTPGHGPVDAATEVLAPTVEL